MSESELVKCASCEGTGTPGPTDLRRWLCSVCHGRGKLTKAQVAQTAQALLTEPNPEPRYAFRAHRDNRTKPV